MMKKLLDKTFLKFVLVGIVNTVFGTAIMFVFYNVLHLSYWMSSASNYVLASILSYFLNKKFTFESKDNSVQSVFRFALNISVCYLTAYGIAKPIVRGLLSQTSVMIQDNAAMFVGMCLFVILNYFGQRLFVFKEKSDKKENEKCL